MRHTFGAEVPLKVVLAPFGSRGDVEPALALATEMSDRGHEVVLCAPANFRSDAKQIGVEFHPAGADFRNAFDGTQRNSSLFAASLRQTETQFDALKRAAPGADIILGIALQFAAPTVAAMLKIPYRYAVFSPIYLRAASLSAPVLAGRSLPPFITRFSWRIEDAIALRNASWLTAKRRVLGLHPIHSLHQYLLGSAPPLGAFDAVLTPMPEDALPAEVTGYWRQDRAGELAVEVQRFLSRGAAPLYLGFGSMKHGESTALLQTLVDSVVRAGQRVIVARGWSEFSVSSRSSSCLVVDEISHDLLLPHVSAAIHHGGAGTTLAAALAGVPQIVVPHLGDQFYNGQRIAALGLGPAPLPFRKLNATALVELIQVVVRDASYSEKARQFAIGLRARNGCSRAADLIEQASV